LSLPGFDIKGYTARARAKTADVLHDIEQYTRGRCIKSYKLERSHGLQGVEIRAIVSYLRQHCYAIGSSGGGYFMIKNLEEIEQTIEQLKGRAAKMLMAANGLERIAYRMRERELAKEAQRELL
jgi:hypothetical protein